MADVSPRTDTSTDADTEERTLMFQNNLSQALVASDGSDKSRDQKTLRRLAQNREAARKSRLRKKAYVQQLESSRMKLTQLEQELQRARQQGTFISSSGDQSQTSGGNDAVRYSLLPMTSSREDSPDWLRSFQPPTNGIELSSGTLTPSENSLSSDDEDSINLSKLFKKQTSRISDIDDNGDGRESTVIKPVKGKSPKKTKSVKQTAERKRKKNEDHENEGIEGIGNSAKSTPRKRGQPQVQNHSIWSLSSDSEPTPNASPARSNYLKKESIKDMDYHFLEHHGESPLNQASDVKSPRKKMVKEEEKISKEKNGYSDKVDDNPENDAKDNVVREDVSGKHHGPQVSSSRLPLLLSEKVQRLKALVECEGNSIDLSGDVGAVGRVVISDDSSSNHEMFLDLKGTMYKTTIVPSRTFCVVSFSQSEAKIEAIMNDFIQLKPQFNVNEAETMVEGTLDGFSFDSEDEVDNLPKAIAQTDQNEAAEDQPNVKTKRAKKTSGVTRKIGKSAGGKPSKKMEKKPQAPKQRKTKK